MLQLRNLFLLARNNRPRLGERSQSGRINQRRGQRCGRALGHGEQKYYKWPRRANRSRERLPMGGTADVTSRYRRLQRFFSEVRFDYDALARLIVCLFGFDRKPFYLTLDRTNWQWGKKNLNLLTLGIVYKGAAIPVYWLVLNKKGNSSQRERIALLKRFVRQFGSGSIQGILGDREFIGQQWWGWLNQQQIPFVMRMKANQLYRDKQGRDRAVGSLFKRLAPGASSLLRKTRHVSGLPVWLSASPYTQVSPAHSLTI